jgi:hypothetical protein
LYSDELISVAPDNDILNLYYNNSLSNDDGGIWSKLYEFIFRINGAIEGIESSQGISAAVKEQLLGECKFLRGYMYFYLVNLYGDVPLILSTDVKKSSVEGRTSINVVYDSIISDLKFAQTNLSDQYLAGDVQTPSADRLRPNKAAATFLLARTYLYNDKAFEAEAEASKVINDSRYALQSLNNVFFKNSPEAIWQLQPVTSFANTLDGQLFVLLAGNNLVAGTDINIRPVYLNNSFRESFDKADNRRSMWIDSVVVDNIVYPFAYKYKAWRFDDPITEYLMVFRLAELFLIRAEARANIEKLTGPNSAITDINIIRNRAGLASVNLFTKSQILEEIMAQRKFELFTEMGARWLDIKRSNKTDQIMAGICQEKGFVWSSFRKLFPIPVTDINRNPSFRGHQNPGYPEN